MILTTIRDLLADQPLLAPLEPSDLDRLAGCGRNEVVRAGTLLAREGEPADQWYVVRRGRLAIELHAPVGPLVIETAGAGDIVGWSWIFPPYRWTYDVAAVEQAHVVVIDGTCLRASCEDDPAFGYRVMQRFAGVLAESLQATRMRLVDLYGGGGGR